jgi:hypothetical protein
MSSLEIYWSILSTYSGTRIAIPEYSLNIQDFSSKRLSTPGVIYSQRCFRESIIGNPSI